MSAFLSTLAAWWVTWGPWIGAGLIPTIITGLSLSPKLAPEAGWVQKIWDTLKAMMGFLSVATPKDAPGTFQLPLKLGKLRKKKVVPPAAAALLIISLGLATQDSCAWWSKHGSAVEEAAVDCAVVATRDAAQDLLPAVLAILTGGSINWQEQVSAFGKQFGQDAVACALEMASNKLMGPMKVAHPGAGSGSGSATPELEGFNKAKKYMLDHHMKVKE